LIFVTTYQIIKMTLETNMAQYGYQKGIYQAEGPLILSSGIGFSVPDKYRGKIPDSTEVFFRNSERQERLCATSIITQDQLPNIRFIDVEEAEQLLSGSEVAKILNMHPNILRKGIVDLPEYKLGSRGDRRYDSRDVIYFLNSRSQPVAKELEHPSLTVDDIDRLLVNPMLIVADVAKILNLHPNQIRENNIGLPEYKLGSRGDNRYDPGNVTSLLNHSRVQPIETESIESLLTEEDIPRLIEVPLLTINAVARILNMHPNILRKGIVGLPEYKLGSRGDRRYDSRDVIFLLNNSKDSSTTGSSIDTPLTIYDLERLFKEPLLSITETSQLLSVHPNTIRSWRKDLVPYRIGSGSIKDRRFDPEEVKQLQKKLAA